MSRATAPLLCLALLWACSDHDLSLAPGDGDLPSGPAIAVDPSSLDFGAVRVGRSGGTLPVTVSNVGTAALDLLGLDLDTAWPDAFLVTDPADARLDPGASTTFTVTYGATAEAAQGLRVSVRSTDPESPSVPVDAWGEGVRPRIRLTPDLHDFGAVPGGTTQTLLVSILNEGTDALRVDEVRIDAPSGEFALDPLLDHNGALPWSIPPGGDLPVRVDYGPLDDSGDVSTVTVVSDDPDHGEAEAIQLGAGTGFKGFSTGWYVYDDGIPYETTSNPSHVVDHHGDEDLYWYEPSGAHGLIDSVDPTTDFAVLRDYILAHAPAPVEPTEPFDYDAGSTLATFAFATFTYFLCDFYLDPSDDPALYEIRSGTVDDGIQVMVNGAILGRLSLGEAGRSWPLTNAFPGAVNSLVVILVDDSQVNKYVHDLAFYRDGMLVTD